MPIEIDITMATTDDLEACGHVMLQAMDTHLVDRFMVPEQGHEAAYKAKMNWFLISTTESLKNPAMRIFKATLKETDTIVGLGAIKYHDGNFGPLPTSVNKTEKDPTESGQLPTPAAALPPAQAKAFAPYYFSRTAEIHRKHMEGQKHVGEFKNFLLGRESD
jgi:hypothetical protein